MNPQASPPELALVLHAHLPWVRHDREDEAIEERWLFEAVIETYLPLLGMGRALDRDRVPGALVLSLSPTLVAMLRDPALRARFETHFAKCERLAGELPGRLSEAFRPAAEAHRASLAASRTRWDDCRGDLAGAFGDLQSTGRFSLWTCADPHPLLPLWMDHPWFVDASIERAISLHRNAFGTAPRGLWLPECGYAQGLDVVLARHGIAVTVLETHGVLHGTPRPSRGVGFPVRSPAGVVFAGRDPHAATSVWSRDVGYPGDPVYADFHTDLGHDRPEGFVAPDGTALRTGARMFAVTDRRGGAKVPWDPRAARARAAEHAEEFVARRAAALDGESARISVAPYDAELFGHWWAEGVTFLDAVLRACASRGDLRCVALDASDAVRDPALETVTPAPSTWGRGGYLTTWLDGPAAYMARELDAMARALEARGAAAPEAAREALFAASASDWAFLLNGGGAPHYARRRFDGHRDDFWRAMAAKCRVPSDPCERSPHRPGEPRP